MSGGRKLVNLCTSISQFLNDDVDLRKDNFLCR